MHVAVETKRSSADEQTTKRTLEQLLVTQDVSDRVFTKRVVIEERGVRDGAAPSTA